MSYHTFWLTHRVSVVCWTVRIKIANTFGLTKNFRIAQRHVTHATKSITIRRHLKDIFYTGDLCGTMSNFVDRNVIGMTVVAVPIINSHCVGFLFS